MSTITQQLAAIRAANISFTMTSDKITEAKAKLDRIAVPQVTLLDLANDPENAANWALAALALVSADGNQGSPLHVVANQVAAIFTRQIDQETELLATGIIEANRAKAIRVHEKTFTEAWAKLHGMGQPVQLAVQTPDTLRAQADRLQAVEDLTTSLRHLDHLDPDGRVVVEAGRNGGLTILTLTPEKAAYLSAEWDGVLISRTEAHVRHNHSGQVIR